MSKFGYFLLGFGTGACIMGGVTIFLVKKERKNAEEEIESVRKAYVKHRPRVIVKAKNDEGVKEIPKEEKKELIREADRHIQYNGYAKLVREEPPKDVVTAEEELPIEDNDEDEAPVERLQDPYVITPEEYADEPEYAKEDLFYYILSDTLIDDHEVEVDDIDRLIGSDNLRHMGEIEPGCLWIRNPNVMTDYQITGVHGHWEG